MHYIIVCRSMTAAQRASRLLQRAGIFCSVTKAPQSANPGGCSYGVKLGERNLVRALELLREAGLPAGKFYTLDARGTVREAAL